jgi:hypothetical protein
LRGGTGYISAVSMKLMPVLERPRDLRMRFAFGVLLAPGHRAEADVRDFDPLAPRRLRFMVEDLNTIYG